MRRPTSVTVFGVLNIVFSVFGGVGLLVSLALFSLKMEQSNNPVVRLIHENAAYAAYLKASILLGVPSCLALLAAGIGLLCLKPWARILSIIYAVYAVVAGIAGAIVNFFAMFLPMVEQARQQHGQEAAAVIGGAIGGTIGGCIGLIYPVLLLIFMLLPKITAAFHPVVPAQA